MTVVVLLEDVLFDEEAEEGDRLVEDDVDFVLRFLQESEASVLDLGEENAKLTPLSPLRKFSSTKSEMYSGDLRFLFTKTVNACETRQLPPKNSRKRVERTSLILFSNALSAPNASTSSVSNLSFKSSTLCTHASAALVLAPPCSPTAFLGAFFPSSPSLALPFPFGSTTSSSSSGTNNNPSFTCCPTRTIHAEIPAWSAAWPVGTRPKRVYMRSRSAMRESWMRVESPQAGWSRMAERWDVMRVFSRRLMRRGSVEGAR